MSCLSSRFTYKFIGHSVLAWPPTFVPHKRPLFKSDRLEEIPILVNLLLDMLHYLITKFHTSSTREPHLWSVRHELWLSLSNNSWSMRIAGISKWTVDVTMRQGLWYYNLTCTTQCAYIGVRASLSIWHALHLKNKKGFHIPHNVALRSLPSHSYQVFLVNRYFYCTGKTVQWKCSAM